MTNIIDLMADDIWTEADIVRRTESMIRSYYSLDAETIINRRMLGLVIGVYTPTTEELAEAERYTVISLEAKNAGNQARADMALLTKAFPVEAAQTRLNKMSLTDAWKRLQLDPVEPILDESGIVTNQEEVDRDTEERQIAESVVAPYIIEQPDGSTILDPNAIQTDIEQRNEAQNIIDSAEPEVIELVKLRKQFKAGIK